MARNKSGKFKNIRRFIRGTNSRLKKGERKSGAPTGRRLLSLDEALDICSAYEGDTNELPFNAVMRRGESPSGSGIDTSGKYLNFLDKNLTPSVCKVFAESLSERIDPSRLMKEKDYTFKWTNRVALWRFFERYVTPIVKSNEDQVGYLLKHQVESMALMGDIGDESAKSVDHTNPFGAYEHAFAPIMETWQPLMKRAFRVFVTNNPAGTSLRDDFLSISYIAFLHALEKQAMAILGSIERAQGIPFSKRLEFAIRKQIRCDLPDMTGPVRVPIESEQRKQMPTSISLDALLGDKPENG